MGLSKVIADRQLDLLAGLERRHAWEVSEQSSRSIGSHLLTQVRARRAAERVAEVARVAGRRLLSLGTAVDGPHALNATGSLPHHVRDIVVALEEEGLLRLAQRHGRTLLLLLLNLRQPARAVLACTAPLDDLASVVGDHALGPRAVRGRQKRPPAVAERGAVDRPDGGLGGLVLGPLEGKRPRREGHGRGGSGCGSKRDNGGGSSSRGSSSGGRSSECKNTGHRGLGLSEAGRRELCLSLGGLRAGVHEDGRACGD